MTTPATYTGHPDWIPTNSSPIPVLAAESATFAAGTWGPVTITCTSGGAYMIAVNAATPTDLGFSDFTVKHYDFKGNLVWTDFFGAVMFGAPAVLPVACNGPTILRGNIYGSTLQISGQVGNSGFLNGVLGTAGFTASGMSFNAYILPNGLGDPDPKLSNGSVTLDSVSVPTPGGLLAFFYNETLTESTSTSINPIVPYSGEAILCLEAGGALTTPADFVVFIRHWTVANTATPFAQELFQPAAMNQGNSYDINIPACLTTMEGTNASAAQSVGINVTLTAKRSA
jgi:hypothetical protein